VLLSSEKWKADLASWAIPESILAQASDAPWVHPPLLFQIPDVITDSPSHQRARDVLPENGSVLDVGCGGGVASFAITPPAITVIGVDEQQEMLNLYAANAEKYKVECQKILGLWPEVANKTPKADVVAVHHVVFNVGNILPFLRALDEHAHKRVVIEAPVLHPMSNMNSAWRHFWNLDRPHVPHISDLINVLREIGIDAHIEYFTSEFALDKKNAQSNENLLRRLCLSPDREGDLVQFLEANPLPARRELATIWWDK
jgi:SAM-dependent methyltransferase